MRNLLTKPMPSVVVLTCMLSANAAAQTPPSVQQSQSSRPSSGHDMSTMDHAQMGHQAPASNSQTRPKKAPQGSRKAAETGHSGHGGTATMPQAGESPQQTERQSHGSEHPANTAQPKDAPAVQPQASPGQMSGMDHSDMGHGAVVAPVHGSAQVDTERQRAHSAGSAASMGGGHPMQMGPMQGGKPPPDARDPNAYNEGTRFANLGNHEMNDNAPFWRVLVDKAEAAKGDGERGQNLELDAWYGNDYHKAWVKVEGERRGGALEASRSELLWDRAFAPFWSTQLGVRHDGGQGGGRNWLAFGVQGLAPYWFETEATAYWRSGSGAAARLNAKYEVLFTPRLILEPELGANLYSRADPERGTGERLSDISAALRLRYEITRKFAPYVGVTWNRQFGGTADFTRMRGGDRSEVQAVAGVRLWF